APLLAALLNGALSVWVSREASDGLVRRTFLAWNSVLAIWNLCIAIVFNLNDPVAALIYYKWIRAVVVVFIAPCFLHFVVAVTETNQDSTNVWVIRFGYASIPIFAIIAISTDFFIQSVRLYYWGYYPLAGPGNW